MMNEDIFWQLIEQSQNAQNSNFETQCVTLTELLTPYEPAEIITFENILRAKIEEASNFKVMAATFVVCSYISDDTYEDFRAWLVGQGKEKFYKAIKDPNYICDFLRPKQAEELGGEFMLFVAVNAYLEKTDTDDEDAFYEMIDHPDEKEVSQKWPDNKEQYRKLFPRLFDMFWNQERMEELLNRDEEEEED